EKEGKRKTKGAPLPIVPTLQKFLKTYEKHCAQTQTSVCPAIKRDLKTSINHERILRKALLLESKGRNPCPFTTLKLIDCRMDSWSLGRLGRALQFSRCIFLSSITANLEMKKLRVFSQAWRTIKGFKALVWSRTTERVEAGLRHTPECHLSMQRCRGKTSQQLPHQTPGIPLRCS
ncbi:hypothetical protein EI555_011971, partial [Monodon monoceros]